MWLLRQLGLRGDDRPPEACEILVPLILWSVVFEIGLPAVPGFQGLATPDYLDVLAYAVGALTAAAGWRMIYPPQTPLPAPATPRSR